jgi:hypothetical protein
MSVLPSNRLFAAGLALCRLPVQFAAVTVQSPLSQIGLRSVAFAHLHT